MRGLFILTGFIFLAVIADAQQLSNYRVKQLQFESDSLLLDTLSVVAGSEKLLDEKGVSFDPSYYRIDYSRAVIYLTTDAVPAKISYRVFLFLFQMNTNTRTSRTLNRIKPKKKVRLSILIRKRKTMCSTLED